MKHKLLESSVVRYVFAGGLAYAVELTVLIALHKVIGTSAELATAVAFWVGLSTSFILQKHLAFRDYERTLKSISKQIGRYALLVAFNYVFTLSVVAVFPESLVLISRTLALILTTIWNYYIYNRFIFNASDRTGRHKIKLSITNIKSVLWRKQTGLYLLFMLPILLFFYQYLATGNKIQMGDFDYYAQQYEAMRISILKYHQFPLWNPWLSGGIPLFANPQFGLFSIQALLVIIFGTVYGMKLAFVFYAICGFWGMFVLGRKLLGATVIRSALVSYIWTFSGFFAGHTISHFTFASFFLLPWLIYFLSARNKKFSWLWLGVVVSIIIQSSVHYALLMMGLSVALYFFITLLSVGFSNDLLTFRLRLSRNDLMFAIKSGLIVLILSGYRFYVTYKYQANNPRVSELLDEAPHSIGLLLKSMFLPIGSLIKKYPNTMWGWGEYSMYIGMATGLALLYCLALVLYRLVRRNQKPLIINRSFIIPILILGLIGVALAMGDYGTLSPFHLLRLLPGFTQTRVPSRWLIITVFSLLVFLMAWRKNQRLINLLLLISVVELFLTYGPPRYTGKDQVALPPANFSNSLTQYDNGHNHIGIKGDMDINHSYLFSTKKNIGQVYADDSLINTLSGFTPLPTTKCGINVNPECGLIMSHNAEVTFWSPNKIEIKRIADGPIELNMNVEAGWRINDTYPFALIKELEPSRRFLLPDNENNYRLEYSPKLSPSWFIWRLKKL